MRKELAWLVATLGLGLFPFTGLAQLDTNSPDGLITCRVWQELNGGYVSDLLALPRFPSQPDFTVYPGQSEYYPDANILFGVQMVGFVWPPVSGDYAFYLDSSSFAALYLSSDDNPTNKVQIATEPAALSLPREWVASAGSELQQERGNPPANISSPIPLQAGRKYYLEAVSMFDSDYNTYTQYLGVTWHVPGGPDVVSGQEPILGQYLSAFTAHGIVTITNQPSSLVVGEGQPWQLGVGVDGTPPYLFQWLTNGVVMDGATNQFLTNTTARFADSGTVFTVAVTNCFGSVLSAPATLTVTPDTNPPVVTSVSCATTFDRLFVRFSKPVTAGSATNLANWTCDGGLTFSNAALSDDGREVFLDTSPQTPGNTYTLIVSGVQDTSVARNSIAPGTTLPFTPQPVLSGLALQEIYNRLGGYHISDLTNSAKFPDHRDYTSLLSSAEITPFKENHGVRVSGWIIPPQTGRYCFYVWSREVPATLYLSPDENRSNSVQVAWEPMGVVLPDAYLWTNTWPNRTIATPENRSAWMTLQAGRKYYFETLAKYIVDRDGVGQALTWQGEGDPDPASGSPPLSGSAIALAATPSPGLSTTVPPADQTVQANQKATFSPAITTTFTNVVFQWFRDGQLIPGATNLMYTTPFLPQADDGASFYLVAYAKGNYARSATATVTVLPDTTPPALVSAMADATFEHITVTFSKPILPADATNLANYSIAGGLTASAAVQGPDGSTVVLSTGPAGFYTNATLTVNGLHDTSAAAQVIPADSQVPVQPSFLLLQGFLKQEVFLEMGAGVNLFYFTNDIKFPDHPDVVNYVTNFETAPKYGDDYAARLSGFLLPPVTGDYLFYVASEGDEGALFLSPDEQPENAVLIAHDLSTGSPRNWITPGSLDPPGRTNYSAPIHLVAGRRYYVEALLTQMAEWHGFAVTWQVPGAVPVVDQDPPISGVFLASYAPTAGAQIGITSPPQPVSTTELGQAAFAVAVSTPSPVVFFQWQTNDVDVPGANASQWVFASVPLSANGTRVRCVVNVPGATATSAEALLTILPDFTPPVFLSAEGSVGLDLITLRFSKPLDPSSATNLANYTISGGVAVTNATLSMDGETVVLETSPQSEGSNYTVSVQGLRDTTVAGNLLASGSQAAFTAWLNEEFVGPFPSWADVKRDYGAVGDGLADDTAAFQQGLDEIGTSGHPAVLYVPAGTYRITQTLLLQSRMGVSFVGEDPLTTVLQWNGAAGGVLLHVDGVLCGRVGRMTLDGQGQAESAIWHKQMLGLFASYESEYADMILKDASYGIRAGVSGNDSSVLVLRCQFLRFNQAAISTESYNTLSWIARHCLFEDCAIGITNERQSGQCMAYENVFRRSTTADVLLGNDDGWFSLRWNTSVGSKAFFVVPALIGPGRNMTLQGNVVIQPQDSLAVSEPDWGPLVMLDNIFQSLPQNRHGTLFTMDNLVSVGNTFTADGSPFSWGRMLSLDDRVVDPATLDVAEPELPGFLPNRHRTVIEVATNSTDVEIQAAVAQADQLRGTRPVVHLAAGDYSVSHTIVIPAGSDLQLVGDGYYQVTRLNWQGDTAGPVLRLAGPPRATLREFSVLANDGVKGIAVDNCDQAGARVFIQQVFTTEYPRGDGIRVDRLDQTDVTLHGTAPGGAENFSALHVIGGPAQARGEATGGRVVLFGYGASVGGTNDIGVAYRIENGGSLLVEDTWYESGQPRFVQLSDHANFTLSGGVALNSIPDHGAVDFSTPTFDFENFQGKATMLTTQLGGNGFVVQGDGSQTKVALIGCTMPGAKADNSGAPYFQNLSSNAQILLAETLTNGVNLPDQGVSNADLLREMLQQVRTNKLGLLTPVPAGLTDARFYRVHVAGASVGIELTGVNTAPVLADVPPLVADEGQMLVITNLATDPDLPWQTLTFSLAAGAPYGCVINPTNGVLTWTPDRQHGTGPGSYAIGVVVTDNGSPALSATNVMQVTVSEPSIPLLLGVWGLLTNRTLVAAQDLGVPGDPNLPGVLMTNGPGAYELIAAGSGFWNQDAGFFAYVPVLGDFDASVQILRMDISHGAHPYAPAGLMMREDLRPGARNVQLVCSADAAEAPAGTGDDQIRMNYRPDLDGPTEIWPGCEYSWYGPNTFFPDIWIRLQRQGEVYTAYRSAAGTNWQQIAVFTNDVPYAGQVYVGLAASAMNGASWMTNWLVADFAHYQIITNGLASPPDQVVSEGDSLVVPFGAQDFGLPPPNLTFSLDTAPAGATINPTNGVFSWTPTFAQGPSTNLIIVRVTDDGEPTMTATNAFSVVVQEANQPPVLASIPPQTVNELTPLTMTNTASEANLHATVGYALLNPRTGAGIAANGVIVWTPSEAQGPGTNVITTVATSSDLLDLVNPTLSATNSFTVVVNEVNTAPVLTVPATQTVNELATLSVSVSATDSDIPANPLTFALVSAPPGMTINPASGLITWTPSQAQSPSTNVVQVSVTDTNPPAVNAKSLSVTNSFTVIVREVNQAPVLPAVARQTVNELTLLTVTDTASHANLHSMVSYALLNPPTGASIAGNGVITWTPSKAQGPGTNVITTVATSTDLLDMLNPTLTVTNSFTVVVNEVNTPPILGVLSSYTVNPGQAISFTATATDSDIPTNTLTFSLIAPPTGASIDPGSGLFTWRPVLAQAGTTNTVRVQVTDYNPWATISQRLSDVKSFTVLINPMTPVVLTPAFVSTNQLRIQVNGLIGPDYTLQASTTLTNWSDLLTTNPTVTPFGFFDPWPGSSSNRFYRVRLGP